MIQKYYYCYLEITKYFVLCKFWKVLFFVLIEDIFLMTQIVFCLNEFYPNIFNDNNSALFNICLYDVNFKK